MIRLRVGRACLAAFGMIALAACAAPRVQPAPGCAEAGVGTAPFAWERVDELAGSYRITVVPMPVYETTRQVFAVTLTVNDSAHRYVPMRFGYWRGQRPLEGLAVRTESDRFGPDGHEIAAVMLDSTLYIGEVDGLDGATYQLRPLRVGPRGFTGTYEWDGGLERAFNPETGEELHPTGAFCAVRT